MPAVGATVIVQVATRVTAPARGMCSVAWPPQVAARLHAPLVLFVVVVGVMPRLLVQLVNVAGVRVFVTDTAGFPVVGIVPLVWELLQLTLTEPALNTAAVPATRSPAISSPAGSTSTPVPAGQDCA